MFGEACSDSFDLTTSAGRVGEGLEDQITNYVRDNPDTGLIIIDTLILIRGEDDDNDLITLASRGYIIQTTQTIKRIYTPQHTFPKRIWVGLVESEPCQAAHFFCMQKYNNIRKKDVFSIF